MTRPRLGALLRRSGILLGPLAAAAVWAFLPEGFVTATGESALLAAADRKVLALMAWMACWWLTEAIDIEATALLPVVLLPLMGVADIEAAAAPYASPLVFLFLGGFLLARAMQRWGLDRRIALLTLRAAGPRPARLVGGLMVATAVLSSCVSNTATVAMMLPIGLGLLALLRGEAGSPEEAERAQRFEACLLLGTAYAASIGGLGTLIGSPPNGLLAQFARDHLDVEIDFVGWLAIGVPLVVVLLPLTWFLLVRVLHPLPRTEIPGGRELVAGQLRSLGGMTRAEWSTFLVFLAAVVAWVTRPLLARVLPGWSDAGIAITAGTLLFLIPSGAPEHRRVLQWEDARALPWGVLVLFGGGLSLAAAISEGSAADFLGSQARALTGAPPIALVFGVTAGMIFLTELTSNTATAATIVPIVAALAPSLGIAPMELALPAALAASCAFMLPVATPPNAMVFASGRIRLGQMAAAGWWVNWIAALAITGYARWFAPT